MFKRTVSVAIVLSFGVGIAPADTNLNGAGATFPYPIYSKWFREYLKAHPAIQINYQSIGSGGGIRHLTEGTVDFGASDGPMTDEQLARAKRKIHHLPTTPGAVVPAHNLAGVRSGLKLSGQVSADIFLGKITTCNDPAVTRLNPGVNLPAAPIIVAHRCGGSGTTYIRMDDLSKVSPAWPGRVGKGTSVTWPVGLRAQRKQGVSGLVRQLDGAIGCVELVWALRTNISYGSYGGVQNAAGNFVTASLESTTAAAASAKIPPDFRVSITNASGQHAYPIASFTWMLIPAQFQDASKEKIMVDFLHRMLDQGQGMMYQLHYAPLPKEVAEQVRAVSKTIHEISGAPTQSCEPLI